MINTFINFPRDMQSEMKSCHSAHKLADATHPLRTMVLELEHIRGALLRPRVHAGVRIAGRRAERRMRDGMDTRGKSSQAEPRRQAINIK